MTVLTYRYLGDAIAVGDPLGCDTIGWPYRVEAIEHADGATRVTVEPWPLPSARPTEAERNAHARAMAHARQRLAGVTE